MAASYRGKKVLWLSWADDFQAWDPTYLDGLDLTLADAESADFVLLHGSQVIRAGEDATEPTGVFESGEANSKLLAALRTCAERGLTMVCANPDFTVTLPDGTRGYMPGCIARAYEGLLAERPGCGAAIAYFGKPHQPAFDAALRLLGPEVVLGRVVHVGDSLLHDVAGANGAGIDSIFVAGGIHAEELGVPEAGSAAATSAASSASKLTPAALQALFGSTGVTPTLTVEAFTW